MPLPQDVVEVIAEFTSGKKLMEVLEIHKGGDNWIEERASIHYEDEFMLQHGEQEGFIQQCTYGLTVGVFGSLQYMCDVQIDSNLNASIPDTGANRKRLWMNPKQHGANVKAATACLVVLLNMFEEEMATHGAITTDDVFVPTIRELWMHTNAWEDRHTLKQPHFRNTVYQKAVKDALKQFGVGPDDVFNLEDVPEYILQRLSR